MAIEQMTQVEENAVQQLIQDQKRIYYEAQQVTHHLRRMRSLRLDTRTPRAFQRLMGKGVRVPLSWALVQTINGMVTRGLPQFTRTSISPRDRKRDATLASSCWPLIQTYSAMAKKDLFYMMVDSLSGDGGAVVKLQRRQFQDYPDRAEGQGAAEYNQLVNAYIAGQLASGKSPLRLNIVDRRTFMPSRENEPSYVVESGRRAMIPTLRTLGLTMGVNGEFIQIPEGSTLSEWEIPSGTQQNVMMDEVWTADAAYFSIGGKLIKCPNDLGFIPYAWRNGMTTAIPDPVLEGVSVVFPFYGLEPHLNTLVTSLISWSLLSGMPTAVVTQDPTPGVAPGQETPPTDLPLGQMVTLAAGKKLAYASPPPIGNTVTEVINIILQFYERAGVTSAARGLIGTRTPGLTFTSALEAAADMIGPIQAGVEGLLEDICRMTWMGIEQIGIPMMVTGTQLIEGSSTQKVRSQYVLRPNDIRGYYDIHCDLRPESTQDKIQKGLHGASMLEHGLWSWERAAAFAGVENIEQERQEIMKDKIRNSPFYLAQVEKAALADEPDLQAAYQQAQQQGVGLLTPPGAPPGATGEVGPGGPISEGTFGSPSQIRGLPAPSAGGRVAGAPRRPTGPRQLTQGRQMPH